MNNFDKIDSLRKKAESLIGKKVVDRLGQDWNRVEGFRLHLLKEDCESLLCRQYLNENGFCVSIYGDDDLYEFPVDLAEELKPKPVEVNKPPRDGSVFVAVWVYADSIRSDTFFYDFRGSLNIILESGSHAKRSENLIKNARFFVYEP